MTTDEIPKQHLPRTNQVGNLTLSPPGVDRSLRPREDSDFIFQSEPSFSATANLSHVCYRSGFGLLVQEYTAISAIEIGVALDARHSAA